MMQTELNQILIKAIDENNLNKVKEVIGSGAEVNYINDEIFLVTPLHSAILKNLNEIVEFLLENGADIEAKDEFNQTPLHLANIMGNMYLVSILLNRGADINARNEFGNTVFHLAMDNKHTELVKFLLGKNPDFIKLIDDDFTPLHSAAVSKNIELIHYFLETQSDDRVKVNNETYFQIFVRCLSQSTEDENNFFEFLDVVKNHEEKNSNDWSCNLAQKHLNINDDSNNNRIVIEIIKQLIDIHKNKEKEVEPIAMKGKENLLVLLRQFYLQSPNSVCGDALRKEFFELKANLQVLLNKAREISLFYGGEKIKISNTQILKYSKLKNN